MSVLVTRPEALANSLIYALKNQGFEVHHFPTLIIKLLTDNQDVQQAIQHLTNYQWQIFSSRNAVKAVMPKIITTYSHEELSKLNWATVGKGTAEELENFINKNLDPRLRGDDENKSKLKHMQNPTEFFPNGWLKASFLFASLASTSKRIRRQDPFGREQEVLHIPIIYPKPNIGAKALYTLLEDKIKKDNTVLEWCGDNPTGVWPGAKQVMCYQRIKTTQTFVSNKKIDYIIVTSGSSMEYLDITKFQNSKLVVISERLKNLAITLGFQGKIILAKGADDLAIINAIKGDLT